MAWLYIYFKTGQMDRLFYVDMIAVQQIYRKTNEMPI